MSEKRGVAPLDFELKNGYNADDVSDLVMKHFDKQCFESVVLFKEICTFIGFKSEKTKKAQLSDINWYYETHCKGLG